LRNSALNKVQLVGKGVATVLLLRNVQYFIIVFSFVLNKRPK